LTNDVNTTQDGEAGVTGDRAGPEGRTGATRERRSISRKELIAMTTIVPGNGGSGGTPEGSGGSGALITIVLDKSGSMEVVREATIDGFNAFKAEQAGVPGGAAVSLSVFDYEPHQICSAVPISEVTDLTAQTYRPDGCTALYDAIADGIAKTDALIIGSIVAPERVLFAVITDGEENASRHFTQQQVFDMVREHEKTGWTFVFLGANIDSYVASQSVGVQGAARHRDWEHSDREMRRNMAVLNSATSRWRAEEAQFSRSADRAFFAEADERAGDDAVD
jgi:hypothetical protein